MLRTLKIQIIRSQREIQFTCSWVAVPQDRFPQSTVAVGGVWGLPPMRSPYRISFSQIHPQIKFASIENRPNDPRSELRMTHPRLPPSSGALPHTEEMTEAETSERERWPRRIIHSCKFNTRYNIRICNFEDLTTLSLLFRFFLASL